MKKKILWALLASLILGVIAISPYVVGQFSDMLMTKNIMEKGYALWSMDKATAMAIGAESDPTLTRQFKEKLASAYTPDTAAANYATTVKVLKDDGNYAQDNSFDKVDMVILWWEGSTQRGNKLSAKYFGYFEKTKNGEKYHNCESTFEVFMERANTNSPWLISSYSEHDAYEGCRS